MSLAVFVIAAVPAAVVYTVSVWSQSKPVMWLAATCAALLGMATGSAQYAGLDLIAVVVALFLANATINMTRPAAAPTPPKPPEPERVSGFKPPMHIPPRPAPVSKERPANWDIPTRFPPPPTAGRELPKDLGQPYDPKNHPK